MTIFRKILATTAICLAAVGLSSCTGVQSIAAGKYVQKCYFTYSVGHPWPAEAPAVLRLNETWL